MSIGRWKAEVPFVSHLSIMNSTRTSKVEPRFVSFEARDNVWDMHFHARDINLRYAFCSKRWISDTNAIVIPWKIGIVPPQVIPLYRGIMPEAPLL